MAFRPVYSSQLTDQQIRKIFIQAKGVDRISCSKCSTERISWINERKYRCKNCWSVRSLTTKTWLEYSKIPLRLWYELVWCFAVSHSAHKAGKLLKKDPALCWKVYQIIRKAINQQSFTCNKITGTVEVDESYYGGEFKNLRKETRKKLRKQGLAKRGRGAKYRKQPVFGIYQRNGKVYLELIPDAQKPILQGIIKKRVVESGKVYSDTHTGYQGLVGLGYIHRTVNHAEKEYTNGKIHINGIEGFWGLSKTNMHTYKGIRKKNWRLYLKEMEFRYNKRHLDFNNFVTEVIKTLMAYRRRGFVPI